MNPHLLWPLGVLLALTMIAAVLGRRRRRGSTSGLDRPWSLEPKRPLLSEPEQVLYRRLVEKACPRHIILCQVQLMQALRFKRGGWSAGLANRISQLSIDFLIVRRDTSIVAAVERRCEPRACRPSRSGCAQSSRA